MRVLFIAPRYAPYGRIYHLPLGMAYVSAMLRKAGHDVRVLNLTHCQECEHDAIGAALDAHSPVAVLTGGLSTFWAKIDEIIRIVSAHAPHVFTIIGGPIVTASPRLAMEHIPAHFGIRGEGEFTALNLINALEYGESYTSLAGIIYRSGSELVVNNLPAPIKDLDSLPMPDYEGFEFERLLALNEKGAEYLGNPDRKRAGTVITSRSCPFKCTFCYHPLGDVYRQRSLDNVFEEIDFLVKIYRINILNIFDELFSANKQRMREFCDRIKEYAIPWACNLRVADVDVEMVRMAKAAGAFFVFLGVESHSDSILLNMKKKITTQQIDAAFAICAAENLRAQGAVILGDPKDTLKTMTESLNWVLSHPEYRLYIDFIYALPDSEIYRYALEKKKIVDEVNHIMNGYPVVNLTTIADKKFFAFKRKVEQIVKWQLHKPVVKKIDSLDFGEHVSITTTCPYCGKEVSTKRLKEEISYISGLLCKHCYGDFYFFRYSLYSGLRKACMRIDYFLYRYAPWCEFFLNPVRSIAVYLFRGCK